MVGHNRAKVWANPICGLKKTDQYIRFRKKGKNKQKKAGHLPDAARDREGSMLPS